MSDETAFYERDGLHVRTYDIRTEADLEGTSVAGDVDWYVDRARASGGPVLEAACGTGRVAWPIAAAGFEVTGFDASVPMLEAARAKAADHPPEVAARATFVEGDFLTVDLGRTFPLVLVPFRAFQVLLTPEDQRTALERLRAHLADDGRLVLDLFDPKYEYLAPGSRYPMDRSVVPLPGGDTTVAVTVSERECVPLTQTFREVWTFTEQDTGGAVLREEQETLRLRWSFRDEMRHQFALTGLVVEAEYSDFTGAPPAYGREQIWVLRKG